MMPNLRLRVASTLVDDPIRASSLGLSEADGRLAVPSEAARSARLAWLDGWEAEVDKPASAMRAAARY